MNIIKVDCLPLSIFVGYERENDARGVAFDYSAWTEQYGDGVLQLLVQRPGDTDPYPVVLTAGEDGTAVWSPSATDTAAKGWVEIQLIFMVGSVVAKTAVLQALVDRSLTAGSTPPDPYETWLETLTELAEQILHTTQPPEIQDGYWYIFDPDTGEYVNSGVKAEGEDGVGITGAQLNADYTLTLTFSDGTSYTTPSIRGAQGEIGPTPQLSVGTVTTGAAGSSAAVEISGTPEAPVLNFTIPRGDTGEVSEAELQAALLDKADVITDTASGAIASFPDGAAAPVKALTVAVEPVQDLNRYDAPWPAGGGKNKFNADRTASTPTQTNPSAGTRPREMDTTHYFAGITRNNHYDANNVTDLSVSGGEISVTVKAGGYGIGFPVAVSAETAYTLSFTNTGNGKISIGYYDASWNYLYDRDGSTPPYTFTTPANCAFAVLVVTPNVFSESSKTASVKNVQLELGSSATSFAPYSNECPITGWSAVGIKRTGKNLADASAETVKILGSANGYIYNATGSHVIRIEGGKTYTISMKNAQTIFTSTCATFPEVGDPTVDAYTGTAGQAVTSKTIVTSAAAKYLVFHFGSFDYEELMVNEGATAEPYSAFVGNFYTIQLGQTVYGGTLEYFRNGDSVSLRFVADRAIVDLGSFNWTPGNRNNEDTGRVFYVTGLPVGSTNSLCSIYKQGTQSWEDMHANNYYLSATGTFMVCADYANKTDFATAVTGQTLCYELATPFEITLPQQVLDILTTKGVNNIWSDAGDVSVEYRADTKLYIEKKITAAIAAALNS